MDEFVSGLLDTIINGAGTSDAIADSLKINSNIMSFINIIWEYFMIIGIGMTVIYFLMEMNQKLALEGRDINFKSMFAPFLKLMIAIAVLSQGAKIVTWLITYGNTLVDYANTHFITSVTANGSGTGITGEDIISGLGFFSKLLLVIPALLMWVVSLICSLVWMYKAIGFKIELLFKTAITPIALADIYSGQNANAVRWLKGFLGMAIYAMAFIVVPRIGGALAAQELASSDDLWEILGNLAQFLVVPIAEIGCLGAIKQLTKEVMG